MLFGWGIALPRKLPIYHCSANRDNPFRCLRAPFSSADGRRTRASRKEQVPTARQLTVTAAHTVSCKKYLAVLNRVVIFAFRRTCRTSNLFDKPNQIHEFWVWPEDQRTDSPLAQNETIGPMCALLMEGKRATVTQTTKPPLLSHSEAWRNNLILSTSASSFPMLTTVQTKQTVSSQLLQWTAAFPPLAYPPSFWQTRHWSLPLKSPKSKTIANSYGFSGFVLCLLKLKLLDLKDLR